MSGKSKATDATEQAVKAGQQPAEKVTSVVKRGGEAAGAAFKQAAVAISDAAEKGPTQVTDEAAEKITSVVNRGGTEAARATFKQAAVVISDAAEKGPAQVTDEAAEKITSVVKRAGEAAGATFKQAAVAISDAAEKGPTQVTDEAAEKITSVVKRSGEAAGAAFRQAAVATSDATEKGTTQVTDEAAEKVTSVVERGGEAGAAFRQAAVAVSGAAEKGQKQATQSMAKVMKTAEEFVSFNQGNLEALIKSGQILATGMQDLGKQVAATAQARLKESMATFKALGSVKSVKEAIDLQTTYARSSIEKAMADTSKLTDASFKLAEQAIAPLTARVTLAVEKLSSKTV